MQTISLKQHRLAAWAGLIGPALFVTTFLVEGALRPGYDALSTYVSALSLGPRGWIQIANFIIFGALLLWFTRGVAAEFPTGKAARSGPLLLTLIAGGYLLSGPFVMDPMFTPLEQATLPGTLHGIFGAVVFTLMPVTCFVFLRRFRADPAWQALRGWTLALGTLSAVGVLLLTLTTKQPALQETFKAWLGLIQRTAIIPFMVWLFVFALALRRRLR